MLDSGRSFGKYLILRQLGRGGMGVVFLAEDTKLARQVALKVFDRVLADEQEFERRFLREARTVANLQHPNIVPIHAFEKIDNFLAIEMPFIDGGSLADAMNLNKERRRLAILCMRDVLTALACCHAEGIVHRDVKPSNVLVRGDGVGLLSDFGLAKVLAEQESISMSAGSSSAFFVGTPRYAPPESWEGRDAAPTWDVYSSGMVLYEAFAPTVPYSASTLMGLVKQVLEKPIPPLADVAEDVSTEFSDAVAAMLQRDPARRPPDALAALARLERVPEWDACTRQGERTVVARVLQKPKPLRRPTKAAPRLGWSATIVLALLVLLVAGTGAFLLGRGLAPGSEKPDRVTAAIPASVTPLAVFDTLDPGKGTLWPDHVLLLAPGEAEAWKALAFESTHIWLFDVIPQNPGTFRVVGNWAGYSDPAASLFQHGEIAGSARWAVPNMEMTASLELRNLLDGTRQKRAVVFKRSGQTMSDLDYVNRFASSDFGQPLLYNEVIPRRLDWGRKLEAQFLTRAALREAVPELAPEEAGIVVDGDLNDAPWPASILDTGEGPGVIPGEGNGSPHLFVRRNDEGLYLALRTPALQGEPHLRLTVMPRFDIPVRESSRWSVLVNQDGIKASRFGRGNKMSPWQCHWQVATRVVGSRWQAELYIPFGTPEGVPAPTSGERWRVNCSVVDGSDPDAKPVAIWGSRDASRAQDGMILVFGTL